MIDTMGTQSNGGSPIRDTGPHTRPLETRVGHATIGVVRDTIFDYICAHIVDGRYTGKASYLVQYRELLDHLESGIEPRTGSFIEDTGTDTGSPIEPLETGGDLRDLVF